MKTYSGMRDQNGNLIVFVIRGDGDSYRLPARLDLCNHSPTGFEISYGGSGPAQLAFAILCDCFNGHIASALHQNFKWKFIAGLPRHVPFKISEQAVIDFVTEAARNKDINLERGSQTDD